jgi:hypothetical protein
MTMLRDAVFLTVLVGCTGSSSAPELEDPDSGGGQADPAPFKDDPMEVPTEDCTEDPDAFGGFSVTPLEDQPTVLAVTWDAADALDGRVTFIDALGTTRVAPIGEGQRALLVGLNADADVWLRASRVMDGTRLCSESVSARTGSLPAGLPEAQVTPSLPGPETQGFVALALMTEFKRMAVIYETRTGAPVWIWAIPDALDDLSPIYRVHIRQDGGGVLLNVHESPDTPGGLFRVDWDGAWSFVAVPGATRDFFELEDGTVAMLSAQVRTTENPLFVDETTVRGDRIIEIQPDGSQREVWNIFDDFPHHLGETVIVEGQDIRHTEWAHTNGITHDPVQDDYLLSLPGISAILRVQRGTGELVWTLQNDGGDFTTSGLSEDLIANPHSVQVLEDGSVLVFNRRKPGECSDVTEIGLDLDDATARPVWSMDSDPCLVVTFLGEAHRLDDGDTVVVWSSAGQLDILGPEGELRWRLALDLGAGFGFVDHATVLGPTILN